MQPKLDLAWMQTRQTYHDKLFALADQGVASHLRSDGRNLVVWPEDLGLWAALTGSRAADARASGSLVGAVATLFTTYAPQSSYYGTKYPAVAQRFPPIRQLALELTDTFGRTAIETFSEMASKYHVWLEAGVNMTQSWTVVCNTDEHPPQQACDERDPAKVALLGDPEDPRGYVYEATSPDVSNMALLFGPDGKLVTKQVKTYITPSEVGQAEGVVAALDLVPGSITSGLSAVKTPLGTLGFVTSKDAWMPDVVDRLEEAGVDLLLQPEFFSGDVATTSGPWAADTLKASGYSDVQRHPGFSAMVLPSAVGAVFDFTADEQSHIAERLTKPATGKWLIGQPPGPGLTGVTPWVVPDPETRGESIAARRKRLGEAGKKLMPGSGVPCPDPSTPAPCQNGHVETVLWKDIRVGFPSYKRNLAHKRTRFLAARPLSRQKRGERNAAVAMSGKYVAVAFEQQRSTGDRVMVAASKDGGRHWLLAKDAAPKQGGDQQWPAITIDSKGRMTLAWTMHVPLPVPSGATAITIPRVVYAQGSVTGNGAKFGAYKPIDPKGPATAAQWRPALALGGDGVVHAAFVDARTKFPDTGLSQAGAYYTRIQGGKAGAATRLDDPKATKLAARTDNAWAPSVAVSGKRVLVTWIDFQNYDWDVMSRLSSNGGSGFGKQVDSNLDKTENLSDSPRAFFTKSGPQIAWTDFHKRSDYQRVSPLYDTYLAAPGKKPVQADPYGGQQVSTYWPAACGDGKDAIVAFQDSRAVPNVTIARVRGGTRRGHPFSLSDGPSGAYRPSIACSGGRFVAAWEDMRSGPPRIYAALGSLRRVS